MKKILLTLILAVFASAAYSQTENIKPMTRGVQFNVLAVKPSSVTLGSRIQTISSIMDSYRGHDMDRDGTDEINRLSYMPFENQSQNVSRTKKLVLVLVEDRLMNTISGSKYSTNDLLKRLEQYKDDLQAEGYYTQFIKADIYDGTKHQDGQTLLAIRKFLKDIDKSWNLQGVVLVGSFPEAMLVRRWIWDRGGGFDKDGNKYGEGEKKKFLRIVPEIVAHRADLVLADLDGKWENIYVKEKNLESIEALRGSQTPSNWASLDNVTFTSTTFNKKTIRFEDFFWIKDDDYQVISASSTLKIKLKKTQRHPEIAYGNRTQPNPICKPDILVSRINPRNVAVLPTENGLLDSNGRPKTMETTREISRSSFYKQDPATERELLIDYFNRNHNYRVGGNPKDSHRTAAASYGDGLISASNFNNYLKPASSSFGSPKSYNNASLYDYAKFVKTSATIKAMSSHSNSWNSEYGDSYRLADLENLVGGRPWRWKKERIGSKFRYVPSLDEQKGQADLYVHRTIYENNILSETGSSLFIHNGCEVNSPGGSHDHPYNHKSYGGFQNAEGILFFLNGLALATRAKVFYDKPEGFTEEIGKNKKNPFGVGWRAYFERESKNRELAKNVSSNKRTYNWSILGDWTLRVKYDNGLGMLKFTGNDLKDYAIHANEAWFGGWNFDSKVNKIEGKGDFNGDGIDDILITSSWGIGVLTRKGNQWESIAVKPKDTWFGQWRYNASVNRGKDKIEAIADFDGDGKDEILISSSWGIGMLELQGNTFRSIFAKPIGTQFGVWTYNSKTRNIYDNKIEGVGYFNEDNKADILVSKPYGIAVLTLQGNTLNSILVKPKDTWFGQWRYNASVNRGKDKIEAIADFDGDGEDEILITSSWGIGILEFRGNTFNSIVTKPNGTKFGIWTYNTSTVRDNKIEGVGHFNNDKKADILVSKPYGIALLTLSGNTLTNIVVKPVGTRFGGWTYNTRTVWDNKVEKIGDFNRDGRADILMSKPYGIALLTLSGDTFNSLYIKANNSKIGSWHLNRYNSFPVIGNFDGLDGEEIIIYR